MATLKLSDEELKKLSAHGGCSFGSFREMMQEIMTLLQQMIQEYRDNSDRGGGDGEDSPPGGGGDGKKRASPGHT